MPAIVPWQPTEAANQALQHLRAGRCVALPSESTYELVASAFHADALPTTHAAIILGDYPQLFDWMSWATGAGERLFRKLGAGPYLFRGHGGYTHGLAMRLPTKAQQAVIREDRLALRWPEHPIWQELSRADLALVTASVEGGVNAEATAKNLGDRVACVVDAGPTTHQALPSVVESVGRRCRLARPGPLTQEQLDAVTCCRVLFICTGNTCRSPMAESLCRNMLADRLGCSPAQLGERGFCVQSAGLAAMMGSEASSEAVQVATELGADLAQHRSKPASLELLQWADFTFAMTSGHWYTLRSVDVPGLTPSRMLSPRFEDIVDPIGGSMAVYRTCADQIVGCLQHWLPEILEA